MLPLVSSSTGGMAGDSSSLLQSSGADLEPSHETTVFSFSKPSESGDGEDLTQVCGMLMSENEVTNGFVKDGSSLPYIFETNESGKESILFYYKFVRNIRKCKIFRLFTF